MTPDQEARAKRIIERQLAMNAETLDALRRAGLTEEKEVQIEFFFVAPNEAAARALVAHLEANDCLGLALQRSGSFFSRRFSVVGKTHPTAVTPQVLSQWVPWIVVQDIIHGCEFDGWGAQV